MKLEDLAVKRLMITDIWKISDEGDTAIIDIAECIRFDSSEGDPFSKKDSSVEYMIGDKVTSNVNLVKLIDIAKRGGLTGFKVTRVEYKGYIALEAYRTNEELISALAGTN